MEKISMENLINELPKMSISQIAGLIQIDWKNVNFGAKPYLDAMFSLTTINDKYGCDEGRSIVAYFLCNASQWKGDFAKACKKHLNKLIK